jgi:hypothetical protein
MVENMKDMFDDRPGSLRYTTMPAVLYERSAGASHGYNWMTLCHRGLELDALLPRPFFNVLVAVAARVARPRRETSLRAALSPNAAPVQFTIYEIV